MCFENSESETSICSVSDTCNWYPIMYFVSVGASLLKLVCKFPKREWEKESLKVASLIGLGVSALDDWYEVSPEAAYDWPMLPPPEQSFAVEIRWRRDLRKKISKNVLL